MKKLILWFVVAVIIALAVLGGVKTALGKGISLNLDEILTLGIKSPWSETLEQWESPSVVANPVPVSRTFVPSEIVKLGKCESQNDPTVIHLNDGRKGLHSYGQFQWQIPTADKWVIKLGLLEDWDKLEDVDKANWLLDGEFATKLTIGTIRYNPNNWVLWRNCALKQGKILPK